MLDSAAKKRDAASVSGRQKVLAVALAIVVAAAGGIVIGRSLDDDKGLSPRTVASNPGAKPGSSATNPSTVAGARSTRVTGRASSVETNGVLSGMNRITLEGTARFRASGVHVTDAGGTSYNGSLEAAGDRTLITGTAIRLIRPKSIVSVEEARIVRRGLFRIELGERGTIDAESFTIQTSGSNGSNAVTLKGPVTVFGRSGLDSRVTLDAEHDADLHWLDPPDDLRVTASGHRADLSFAGGGSLGGEGANGFVGFTGVDVDVTLKRITNFRTVVGRATFRQVYLNGKPQRRTTAGVDLVTLPAAVKAGARGWFTWAPRNHGNDHDMTMTRIAAISPAAKWVNLALEPLPAMFGGEQRPVLGGDTRTLGKEDGSFFGRAAPIRSVIQRRDADRRDISFDVPSGTKAGRYSIGLLIEGNFDPVRAWFTVTVTA